MVGSRYGSVGVSAIMCGTFLLLTFLMEASIWVIHQRLHSCFPRYPRPRVVELLHYLPLSVVHLLVSGLRKANRIPPVSSFLPILVLRVHTGYRFDFLPVSSCGPDHAPQDRQHHLDDCPKIGFGSLRIHHSVLRRPVVDLLVRGDCYSD